MTDGQGRRFEAWRIKNTHHPHADIVGGYRDFKIIGKFTAECARETLAMVVEIQIIEKQFLNVKKDMHLPFTIARGDFW